MTKLVLKKTKTALASSESDGEKSPLSSSEEARVKLLETIWRFLVLQDKRKRYKQFLNAPKENLAKTHIFELISLATKIFKDEKTLIEVEAPFVIFADIHGQYLDLLDILDRVGWPPERRFLFTGDYVDRGPQSIEVIVLLLYLKILFPDDVYLLRGEKTPKSFDDSDQREFDSFLILPAICLSETDKNKDCLQGISPSMESFDDVNLLLKPFEVPNEGLGCDLVWADPCPSNYEDAKGYLPNETRKTSFYYCQDAVEDFVHQFDLDLIVRGHELVNMGYEYRFDKKCLTIFTAPQYCGWYNDAAVLDVSEDLTCQVITFTFQRMPPALTENQRKMFETMRKPDSKPFEPWNEKTIKDDSTTDGNAGAASTLPPLPAADGKLVDNVVVVNTELKNIDKGSPQAMKQCGSKTGPAANANLKRTETSSQTCSLM